MIWGEIFPFESLRSIGYSSYRVRTGYCMADGVGSSLDGEADVALVREFLRGNVGEVRLSMSEANESVSKMQVVLSSLESVVEKLSRAKELCEEAIYGYYTAGEKAQMQKELESIVTEINETVSGTSYDGNKILTAEGETLSIAIDNGEKIYIFARELGFDAEFDLTSDAKGALKEFEQYGQKLDEFSRFVRRRYEKLLGYMNRLEDQWGQVLGIKSSGFETSAAEVARQTLIKAAEKEAGAMFDAQANVSADTVLAFLDYKVQ